MLASKAMPGERCSWLNDDALGAVDDERALRRHERDFAHVDFFFLRPLLFLELEGDVQRRAVGLAFALRLERAQFRLADFVMAEIERRLFVVALDRENFLEDGLQTRVFPLRQAGRPSGGNRRRN